MAIIKAIQSGTSSATSTWEGSVVPVSGDTADLNGYQVTIDSSMTGVVFTDSTALPVLTALASAIKAKTDQLTFTGSGVVADAPNHVVETRTASQDGYWTDTATWGGQSVPGLNSFVYTNGKQVIVDGTVNCAGLADTTETGGLILDAGGNAALIEAYGDATFADTYVIAEFNGNLTNIAANAGTVPVTMSGGITYDTTRTQFGKTNSRAATLSGALFTLPTTSGKELTVEWWWYPTSLSGAYCGVIPTWGNIEFYNIGSYLQMGGDRLSVNATTDGLTLNAWHHIAITRASSGVTKVYIDGTLRNTQASTPAIAAGTWRWFTGQQSYGAYLSGYTGGLRVTLGSVLRYKGSFTPPSAVFQTYAPAPGSTISGRVLLGTNGAVVQSGNNPQNVSTGVMRTVLESNFANFSAQSTSLSGIKSKTDQLTFISGKVYADAGDSVPDYTSRFDFIDGVSSAVKSQTDKMTFENVETVASPGDDYWNNVTLLLHGDGADGSTMIPDETGNVVTANGGAHISTSASKFGGSSIYFDGANSYLTSSSIGYDLDSTNFSIECFVNISSLSAYNGLFIIGSNASNANRIQADMLTTGEVGFYAEQFSGTISWSIRGATQLQANTWYHLAFVRSGGNVYIYINGVLETSGAVSSEASVGSDLLVGSARKGSQPIYFNGYVDEFRITKGVSRYTTDFTPPTIAFYNSAPVPSDYQSQIVTYGSSTDYSQALTDIQTGINSLLTNTNPLEFNQVGVVADVALSLETAIDYARQMSSSVSGLSRHNL